MMLSVRILASKYNSVFVLKVCILYSILVWLKLCMQLFFKMLSGMVDSVDPTPLIWFCIRHFVRNFGEPNLTAFSVGS